MIVDITKLKKISTIARERNPPVSVQAIYQDMKANPHKYKTYKIDGTTFVEVKDRPSPSNQIPPEV